MIIEINVPDIGADTVEVSEVLVRVGDKVKVDQPLLIVESDKASIEIPSPQAGVVKVIKVAVGDKIVTGKLMMLFEVSKDNCKEITTIKPQLVVHSPEDKLVTTYSKTVYAPDIGSDELEVTDILVKVGDYVETDNSIIIVEGDKASIEIPAPFAGTVKEIKVNVGDKLNTGSLIMVFEVAGYDKDVIPLDNKALQTQYNNMSAKNGNNNDINVSDARTNDSEATEVLVNVNDEISNNQLPITLDNDKILMEASPPFVVSTSTCKVKDQFIESDVYVHGSPIIRRLAREFDIDLTKIKGTGRKGRILREDIQDYVKNLVKSVKAAAPIIANNNLMTAPLLWPQVDFRKFGDIEEIELGRVQKISGANLYRNWVMIPHVTQFDEADITDVEDFRKQQNIVVEKKKLSIKITLLVFIMKAVAKVLEEIPRFNSSISADAQKLTLKKYINISVAVNTINGLVVPVFRNVNKKSIVELSCELTEISKKARSGKLSLSDMQGGCFTISNLGGFGGTAFTPIINAPEVAILGISRSSIKPVWNGKEFIPRLMLPLSLSYDHRVIDGVDGTRFINLINNLMSDIRLLMM